MIVLSVLLILLSAPSQAIEFDRQELVFNNGKKVKVEVAKSFKERAQGLMNRTSMEDDHGMLFLFSKPQKLSFWMKDTYIPLSIGYFDSKKVLREIYDMKPQSLMERFQDKKSYPSQCLCKYALEVNQGWFKKNKVEVGSTFKLIPLSSKRKE